MLKAQTILCITLAVIVGRVAAQDDFSLNYNDAETLVETPLLMSPVNLNPTKNELPVATAAENGLAAYLPSLEEIDRELRKVIANRQETLKRTFNNVVNYVNETRILLDVKGASWQKEEQTRVMNDYRPIRTFYNDILIKYPSKNFTECNRFLTNFETFVNAMGDDFYNCHVFYNNTLTHLAKRIFPSKKAESAALKDYAQFDCKVAEAKDTASKQRAFMCLIKTAIRFYNRPNSDIALTIIVELVRFLDADHARYLHVCPGYAKWHLYTKIKSGSVAHLKRCVTNAISR